MDFSTLKRRVETGQVNDVNALVQDLNLIFDNAMKYNGEGTDYYKMAVTLRDLVAQQRALYVKWQAEQQPPEKVAPAAAAVADVIERGVLRALPVPLLLSKSARAGSLGGRGSVRNRRTWRKNKEHSIVFDGLGKTYNCF